MKLIYLDSMHRPGFDCNYSGGTLNHTTSAPIDHFSKRFDPFVAYVVVEVFRAKCD